jgi:hypothetical protein
VTERTQHVTGPRRQIAVPTFSEQLVKHAATGPLAITVLIAGTLILLVRVPPLVGVPAAIALGIRW